MFITSDWTVIFWHCIRIPFTRSNPFVKRAAFSQVWPVINSRDTQTRQWPCTRKPCGLSFLTILKQREDLSSASPQFARIWPTRHRKHWRRRLVRKRICPGRWLPQLQISPRAFRQEQKDIVPIRNLIRPIQGAVFPLNILRLTPMREPSKRVYLSIDDNF